jgi:hypothetical protein
MPRCSSHHAHAILSQHMSQLSSEVRAGTGAQPVGRYRHRQ